jgi:hypothetical protein
VNGRGRLVFIPYAAQNRQGGRQVLLKVSGDPGLGGWMSGEKARDERDDKNSNRSSKERYAVPRIRSMFGN